SEAGALALKEALADYVKEDIRLKWPNDIYWKDKKLSGTLIETKLAAGRIKDCVFGVGLNVNQETFHSDAPNPVSLCQILGHEVDKEELLKKIIKKFSELYRLLEMGGYNDISAMYHEALYRRGGFYKFRDADGEFEGAIVEVEDDGHLILRDSKGMIREYQFKEVEFII
ncbi:MAG: biotin--[acetyl-CoA-carboxylase] ligase, partial [Prevotella sp.]|nr:biotin--[acetyl-CoA-carboxylase] ligase [Prevotella sp.]